MQASNAKINLDKTHVISLSGQPSTHWCTTLATYGIHLWYDRSRDSPLIYLGYPFSSTPRQRDHFFTAILQKHWSNAQDPYWCLLYPRLRPRFFTTPISIVGNLCATMDLFQDNLIQATIDPKIILQLPLLDTILKPPQPHTAPVVSVIAAASRQCILVSDVLSFDPPNNCLRRKHRNELPRRRRAIAQLVKLLDSWQILFRPFVISACAPAPITSDELLAASTTIDAQCLFPWWSFGPLDLMLARPRTLRRQILAANHPHETPAPTLTLWARFWSISLTSVTRNLCQRNADP
ncbi:uncharacterized protein BYT42DRAFT_549926 [Radiomyces spectabilis]|uniref:uncharacterized protein n=1 Tax=Radiomyces spectabilis TaxID=64574 RepID=UPI00221E61D2|nr:uncharacterized protein BYT42DRAFT_549926 [Radiomyces spectabilis]KAI8365926.1 hypothetical protein BYT42DRAFT_549926 [Radiomyces spectabilis]